MSYIVEGVSTDNYTNDSTLTCPEVWLLDLVCSGNPIAYQLQAASDVGQTGSTGLWLAEATFFVPVGGTLIGGLLRRCTGIRIRSKNAGQPASFYAELIPSSELPPVPGLAQPGRRMGGTYSRI